MAHNNSCGVGRSQDWNSHNIEHELSALYDCAHGAGLAVTIMYDYYIPTDDRDDLFLLEKWRDEDAVAEHGKQPHLARLKEIKAEFVNDTIIEKYIVR